jgi:hypothetical protein
VLAHTAPAHVWVDGHTLRRAESATALREAAEGWLATAPPFGGILVKLRTGSGDARLRIAAAPGR